MRKRGEYGRREEIEAGGYRDERKKEGKKKEFVRGRKKRGRRREEKIKGI